MLNDLPCNPGAKRLVTWNLQPASPHFLGASLTATKPERQPATCRRLEPRHRNGLPDRCPRRTHRRKALKTAVRWRVRPQRIAASEKDPPPSSTEDLLRLPVVQSTVRHMHTIMHPRLFILLTFALGMSTVGLIYLFSGHWWPKWLTKGAELLTKRQSTLRAYGTLVLGMAIGIVCLLLPSLRR